MKVRIIVLPLSYFSSYLFAQTQLDESLSSGVFTAQLATTTISQRFDNSQTPNNYATALGGQLKYETASFAGFSAAAAFYTSQDISFATGEVKKGEQNSELSSTKGNYTQLAETYLDYQYKDFNLRTGRQVFDSPFADSDPIRMVQNTFEATIASYTTQGLTCKAGQILNWQGYDASLENGFTPLGKNGAWFGSLAFANDSFDTSAWFYRVSEMANLFYIDAGVHLHVSDDVVLHGSGQYSNQQELGQSGVEAQIFGALGRVEFAAFTIDVAYNTIYSRKGKSSFSGFGGGALYTSMDTMILDNISTGHQSQALCATLSYDFKDLKLFYAFGEFSTNKNELGEKADIIEQNIGFEYNINNDFQLSAIYAKENDKIDSNTAQNNWDRAQINLIYRFKGKNG